MSVDKFDKKTKPKKQEIIESNIPGDLKKLNQWVCWFWKWDGKKWTKPPCNLKGFNINHLKSELSYDEVLKAYKNNENISGIGFSLRAEDKFCGIDFDDVFIDGKISKKFKKAVKELEGTYIERSPSGKGARVFGVGKPTTRGSSKASREIEIYSSGRYLTITGDKLSKTTRLINIEKQIKKIDKKIYRVKDSETKERQEKGNLEEHENQDPKLTRLRKFLFLYDPNNRETWIKCGMVIHYETKGNSAGYNLWEAWGRLSTAHNFSKKASIDSWKSFGKNLKSKNPLTIATFHYEQERNISEEDKFIILNHTEIEKEKTDKIENILNPWFMKGSINMVHAKRGLGKTHFCLGVALALSSGGTFLKWKAPKKKKVLYIDGEMPFVLLKEFLDIQKKATGLNPENSLLNFITIDKQKDMILPSLSDDFGRNLVEVAIKQINPDVIIFDSLSTCFKIDESSGQYWKEIQDWLIQLRGRGIDVLLVHHDNKSALAQSGRVDKEFVLSTVIHLTEPKGIQTTGASRFQVEYTKKRHFWGDDADPFEARLQRKKEKYSEWEVVSSELSTKEIILKLIKDGNDALEVSKAIGISVTAVRHHVKMMLEDGLLTETDIPWTTRRRRKKSD